MTPTLDNAVGLDTSPQGARGNVNGRVASVGGGEPAGSAHPFPAGPIRHGIPDRGRLLKLAQEAESQSVTFFNANVRTSWARNYRAFRNQHMDGSKYGSPEYRGRSKYFRPKTRIAVMKSMASVAQSLFGTGDVVAVTAQNEADKQQVAAAALKQEVLNYRMSRVARRNSIKWFLTAMGAYQTAKLTGVCISKQSWVYREDSVAAGNIGQSGLHDPYKRAVLEDRPAINLIAPENCLFDPNCDWTNPAQTSQYVILRNPMSVDEVMTMIEQNISAGNTTFFPLQREQVKSRSRSSAPIDTTATRSAREGGKDPLNQTSGEFSRVWVNEVFMRVGDLDVVYWTIDNQVLMSEPMPVRQAYPAFSGERPIVIGYGAIEAHRTFPMSPVESWQPLQMETNDQTNLRLDHMKQVVSPKAKVVRGQKVDLTQVQRAGPHGIVMVNKKDDVEWWQPPDLPQSAFVENNYLNADFDSLAAVFDAGTVSTNRQMNETVGGMKLLANSINPAAAFDLEVFVETWAVPALHQVMKLEEMYENDATVLAIAGQKAKLWERFGIDKITDELLMRETNVTLKVGVGANNLPLERVQQFSQAWGVVSQVLAPFVQAGAITPPRPKVREIVETIFGASGFKDGGERFFEGLDEAGAPPQQGPDPVAMADQDNKRKKLELDEKKMALDHEAKVAALDQKRDEAIARIEMEHAKALAEIGAALMREHHESSMQAREHAHDDLMRERDAQHGMMRDQINASAQNARQAMQPGM